MQVPQGFVELDRRFFPLGESAGSNEEASRSYLSGFRPDSSLNSWEKLLGHQLVVILGEPGSGKSWELRNQCRRLKDNKQVAFYIELERLATSPLIETLPPTDVEQLNSWSRSRDIAWFFLDSVDESKLRRHADFYTALAKLRDVIGTASLNRARFVISSRISEWQPATDRSEVVSRLASGKGIVKQRTTAPDFDDDADDNPTLLVVMIEALDRTRVQKLVESLGVTESGRFVTELDERQAWDFARRPVDVVDMLSFWKTRGRLGGLTELIEHDVISKLRETPQRQQHARISEQRARNGAEQLAAACILCKQQQFRIPDDSFVELNALDAAAVLPPDWLPSEVAALLSRPLFDSATYGRVRFHHRRVAEYLASSWLANRMAEGCPTSALLQLLFDESSGQIVARRSLIPVAAWLCAGTARWNEEVRSFLLKSHPEAAFQFGDPAALSLEYRRALLAAWTERYRDRERMWHDTTPDLLARLADPKLASDISGYIDDRSLPIDVRTTFIDIVRWGKLSDCLPNLLELLRRDDEHDDLKIGALAALRDMGTSAARTEASRILLDAPKISERVCAIVCDALVPDAMQPAEFVQVLERTGGSDDEHPMIAFHLERHVDDLNPGDASQLLAGYNRLLVKTPHLIFNKATTGLSVRFRYLLEVLPAVVLRVLSTSSLSPTEVEATSDAIIALSKSQHFHFRGRDKYDQINQATKRHPAVRRNVFWKWRHSCADEIKEHGVMPWRVYFDHAVLHLDAGDFDWLSETVTASSDVDDRRIVLDTILNLGMASCRDRQRRLRLATANNEMLQDTLKRYRASQRWRWLRRLRIDSVTRHNWRSRWRQMLHRLTEWWRFNRDQLHLHRNIEKLRNADRIDWLGELCREAEKEDGTKWGATSWKSVESRRGSRIATAARVGCEVSWRKFEPPLPHESSKPNSIPYGIPIGLTGINTYVARDGFRYEEMTADDAKRATRYAVNEMNGFPDWLFDLARAQAGPVSEVLESCVRGEWDYSSTREMANDVLADLAWQGGPLADLVRSTALDLLSERDPQNESIFNSALSLVLKTAVLPDARLGEIAADKITELPLESDNFAAWVAVGLQVDADRTIGILELRISGNGVTKPTMARISNRLGGSFRADPTLVDAPDFRRASALRCLIPLFFKYVPPAEDVPRSSGRSYRPTARDDAARFRDGLITYLGETDEREATSVLRELSFDDALSSRRDWILHLIDARLIQDADIETWQAADVRAFASDYETDPKSDADLFKIVCNRLSDIKHAVERSDNSLREEVEPKADEYVLRRFIARKLTERSNLRYTVPQESEIDRKQRPDIRIENPRTDPVSIEVKWADNWTLAELLERLETQLVGQYLRSHHSRYGIYFLGFQRSKTHWLEDGTKYSFSDIVRLVTERASELVAARGEVEQLRVVAIDFTRPGVGGASA